VASDTGPWFELSGQKTIGHSQLPDFGVKLPDSGLVNLGSPLWAAFKDVHGTVQQCLLPLVDHGGVDTIGRGELGGGSLAFQSFKGNTGLEGGIVVSAFRHSDLLCDGDQQTSDRGFRQYPILGE
jgi:hypothetical protein